MISGSSINEVHDVGDQKSAGRPRVFFSNSELEYARVILKFLLIKPPVCICGNDEYFFGIYNSNEIVAKCTKCGYRRRFNPFQEIWGPRQ